MKRRIFSISLSLLAAAMLSSCATVQLDALAVLSQANTAMGSDKVQSLRYSATGTGGTFGQAYTPSDAWPKVNVSQFVRTIAYTGGMLKQETGVSRAEPNGGGAIPLLGQGEQRITGHVHESSAGAWSWNMSGANAVAAPVALDQRIHDLWTTPHGALKAAVKNNATAKQVTLDGKTYAVLSFTQTGRYAADVFIGGTGLVERIESRYSNAVMGDVQSIQMFSNYQTQDGVPFPRSIKQTLGGSMFYDLKVSDVQVNPGPGMATPDNVKAFAERVVTEKASEGIWFLAGGSHNSVLIEMKDYAVLVEAPLYDARSNAVLDEAAKLLPNKPLRYVINSHHHFDHAGGLRTAASRGVTVIASDAGKTWFEKAFDTANSINPDAFAKSGKRASFEGLGGAKRVLSDGGRTVEIYEINDSVHAKGFLMVYLPSEKILIEADAYTPGVPNAPTPAVINGNHQNLVQNIGEKKLAVERILPLHGRMVNVKELMTAVGR